MRKAVQIQNAVQNLFSGLLINEAQADQLERLLTGLERWNQKVNLTAISGFEGLLNKHLLDSLVPLGLLTNRQMTHSFAGRGFDLGSGAGFPGLIIALMLPQVEVVSVEKVAKKVAFQTWAKAELGLTNFTAWSKRFEELGGQSVDFIIARALAEMADLLHWADLFLRPEGLLWAWKGQGFDQEWARCPQALQARFERVEDQTYQIGPDLGGRLLVFKKLAN